MLEAIVSFLDSRFFFIYVVLTLSSGTWVRRDAEKLREEGASLNPGLWTLMVTLAWILAMPAYLILRRQVWSQQLGARGFYQSPTQEVDDQVLQAAARAASVELCSEAALRALARDLRDLPEAEAWQAMRSHYHRHVCADEVDLSRFEQIVLETFNQRGVEPTP